MRSLVTTLGFAVLVSSLASCGGPAAPSGAPARPAGHVPTAAELDADPTYRKAVLGAHWQKLAEAPVITGKQDDVFFVNPSLGWSVNGQGRIFKTEDGGATWTKLIEKPGTFFRAILMTSAARGFAGNLGTDYFPGVTDKEPLYQTSDGGKTWAPVTTISGPRPVGICNMQRLDDKHLFAVGRVGGPSFILTSSDGGASWTSKELTSQLQMLIDVRFTSPSDGIVVGMNASEHCSILRTKDSGTTWKEIFAADEGALCWKISFPSDKVGYVSIQGGKTSSFAKTNDGGETWVERPLLAGQPFTGLGAGFITEKIGWMAGGSNVYRTTDGGETWELDGSLGKAINRFRFVDTKTAYAIGTTIYKLDVGMPSSKVP